MPQEEEPIVTEEPVAGWLRYETPGARPFYKSPVPRTIIRDQKKLDTFLVKEHRQNRMLEITGTEFSFKRRYGLRIRKSSSSMSVDDSTQESASALTDISSSTLPADEMCFSEAEVRSESIESLIKPLKAVSVDER